MGTYGNLYLLMDTDSMATFSLKSKLKVKFFENESKVFCTFTL